MFSPKCMSNLGRLTVHGPFFICCGASIFLNAQPPPPLNFVRTVSEDVEEIKLPMSLDISYKNRKF
jgi:hypothetical protein